MNLTPELLARCYDTEPAKLGMWPAALDAAMKHFEINTVNRATDFLAQLGHESNQLHNLHEVWGPTFAQKRYERNFDAAWPPTAEDQTNHLAFHLGNERNGDGFLFRGTGPVQCTGGKNFKLATAGLRKHCGDHTPDFYANPALLAMSEWGAMYSAWFWVEGASLNLSRAAREHCGEGCNLNHLADAGDFLGEGIAINGGNPPNGEVHREVLRAHILPIITEAFK